jgi:hypothetical protein
LVYESKNVQFEKCRVSHKLHKNNGNISKKCRKYTQWQQEVYPMMTWSTDVQLGKYTRWRRDVHIVSVGITYSELWQVQSPHGRVAKMIKSFAKLMKYDQWLKEVHTMTTRSTNINFLEVQLSREVLEKW